MVTFAADTFFTMNTELVDRAGDRPKAMLAAADREPVYAIVIAALWLKEYEELTPQFYLGVSIILLAVFIQPAILAFKRRTNRG